MEKVDARTLKPDVQEQLRHQAIRLRKSGRKYQEIGDIIGIYPTTICKWFKRYEAEGLKGVKIQKRGRRVGSCRTLKAEQEKQLQAIIRDKTPDQLKLAFALWTRLAVQQGIRQLWGVRMPIRTVGEYLKRWGFTPQKPLRRAYEQNPKAVEKWLREEYPAIAKRAKKEAAEIHWGDETGMSNGASPGRSYAPQGQTPVIRICARRENLGLISTVTNQGQMRFMVYREAMNAGLMIKFLGRLVKDAGRKVFLILDNLKVHHSRPVKEWLAGHQEQIEVFYLPAYCPELNPDEYLNNDLKTGVYQGDLARTRVQLQKKTISHLRTLQKQPLKVKKFFEHPKVAYAA
jgi:transposase